MTPNQQPNSEVREAFERVCRMYRNDINLQKNVFGTYDNDLTIAAWFGFLEGIDFAQSTLLAKLGSDEMREKVQRAIARGAVTGPKDHVREQEEFHWRRYGAEATAVLQQITNELKG